MCTSGGGRKTTGGRGWVTGRGWWERETTVGGRQGWGAKRGAKATVGAAAENGGRSAGDGEGDRPPRSRTTSASTTSRRKAASCRPRADVGGTNGAGLGRPPPSEQATQPALRTATRGAGGTPPETAPCASHQPATGNRPPPPSPRAPARPALASPRGAPHAAGGSETLGFFLAHLSRRLGARGGGGGGRVLDKSQLAGLQNPSRRPPPPPPSHPPRLAPSGKRRWWPRRRRALVPSKGLLPRKPWACWVVERASVRTAAGAVGMGCPFFLLLLYAVVVREAGPAHLRMMQRLSASAGD